MRVLGVIPARYGSTRFPGKPLAMIGEKTMIQRTCEQVLKASLDAVVVATDDRRIFDVVRGFGGQAVMTRADHRSGTDRCREALEILGGNYDAVVNIQGDEPFIDPARINQVADLIRRDNTDIATLAEPITDPDALENPNVVKVVFDKNGVAFYFSRHALPYIRGTEHHQWLAKTAYYRHIGLYAYKASTLRTITALSPGRLEQAESLEQLRWLENGFPVRVGITEPQRAIAIDTPQDLLLIPQEALL